MPGYKQVLGPRAISLRVVHSRTGQWTTSNGSTASWHHVVFFFSHCGGTNVSQMNFHMSQTMSCCAVSCCVVLQRFRTPKGSAPDPVLLKGSWLGAAVSSKLFAFHVVSDEPLSQ
jgi:hypothetical protein